MRFRTIVPSVLAALLLAGPWVADTATAVTYHASGFVAEVSDSFGVVPDEVAVGTPFSAVFTWNPATSPETSDGSIATYAWDPSGSDFSISLSIAGIDASSDPGARGQVTVIDRTPGSAACCDIVQWSSTSVLSSGADLWALEVLFEDATKTVLDDVSLPTMLDLSDWVQRAQVNFAVQSGSELGVVLGDIHALTLVPEPSTGLLVLLGLTGLGSVRPGGARRRGRAWRPSARRPVTRPGEMRRRGTAAGNAPRRSRRARAGAPQRAADPASCRSRRSRPS